jgi:predicted DNA-binding transcriptional regulator YafY
MPTNKHQYLRYEIIHGLLGISKLKLAKDELLEKVNSKLSLRGIAKIQRRTLNYDLAYLKKQDYPIHSPTRGDPYYYYYEAFYPEGTSFDDEDIDILHRGINILKRISGFRIARDIEGILAKLKYTRFLDDGKKNDFIAFEDHTVASGLEWLDTIAEAIQLRTTLIVDYHPFKRSAEKFLFHPYYLKEFRNRWFVLGRHHIRGKVHTLALDRIFNIKPSMDDIYMENDLFDPETYFKQLIGVTWPDGEKLQKIRLQVFGDSVPYVETKKIHHSQQLIVRNENGSIEVEIEVVINYELISTILGFGEAMKVLSPKKVQQKIIEILKRALNGYKI